MTIIKTAKLSGLNPGADLADTPRRLRTHDLGRLDERGARPDKEGHLMTGVERRAADAAALRRRGGRRHQGPAPRTVSMRSHLPWPGTQPPMANSIRPAAAAMPACASTLAAMLSRTSWLTGQRPAQMARLSSPVSPITSGEKSSWR